MVTIRSEGRTSPPGWRRSAALVVDVLPAGAALRDAAAVFRAGQADLLADHPQERGLSASTSTSRTLPLMLSLAMSFLSRVAFGANLVLAGPARRAWRIRAD